MNLDDIHRKYLPGVIERLRANDPSAMWIAAAALELIIKDQGMTDWKKIEDIALTDVETLKQKGISYGDSWKKRGGVGAYMVGFARKVDRIENIVKQHGYDIFKAGEVNTGDIMDDIRDLRAYLLLIEEEVSRRWNTENTSFPLPPDPADPLPHGYVNQD